MRKLMAANWKMYKTMDQAGKVAEALAEELNNSLPADREVLVFPPFTSITTVANAFKDAPLFSVGGQNFHPQEEGAFTGEISPAMLKDAGCDYALTGHSERRHVFGESNDYIGEKTAYALEQGLKIVLCVGETIEEREGGRLEAVLEEQLRIGLSGVDSSVSAEDLAIAYEPVWAIGSGRVAQIEDIRQAHAYVREQLAAKLANGGSIRILYGGSVKPENCADIIALDNVDGVLVGGASLQAESFSRIITAGA